MQPRRRHTFNGMRKNTFTGRGSAGSLLYVLSCDRKLPGGRHDSATDTKQAPLTASRRVSIFGKDQDLRKGYMLITSRGTTQNLSEPPLFATIHCGEPHSLGRSQNGFPSEHILYMGQEEQLPTLCKYRALALTVRRLIQIWHMNDISYSAVPR